jgi:hypothetical protein
MIDRQDREAGNTMPDESFQVMTEQQIRAELGETLDQLQILPADAFAERSKLRARQGELGRMLREIDIPGAEGIAQRWSELAAGKDDEDEVKPIIESPIESGGGAGV